jgi:glyoxylase-like metal-dependent hydrolase (beta-lactamase superfamily II)
MELHSFTVGPLQENTYLLIEQQEALLVDPGFHQQSEVKAFQKKLDTKEATLKGILLTHAHVDHVMGLHDVLAEYDVPVYLNNGDRYLWNNFASQAQLLGIQVEGFNFEPENLPPQKNWTAGSFRFDVLFTPGHAPEHISLYHAGDQIVIAGDVLFKESIGRTDLYKGDMEMLKHSIQEQLYSLPDETKVYPGHGPATTIGHEKKHNPFVRGTENTKYDNHP